jgi:hypothetical protein
LAASATGLDPDAHLDLQVIIHRIYDAARYESYIYDGAPEPALSPEQQAWATSLLQKQGTS